MEPMMKATTLTSLPPLPSPTVYPFLNLLPPSIPSCTHIVHGFRVARHALEIIGRV